MLTKTNQMLLHSLWLSRSEHPLINLAESPPLNLKSNYPQSKMLQNWHQLSIQMETFSRGGQVHRCVLEWERRMWAGFVNCHDSLPGEKIHHWVGWAIKRETTVGNRWLPYKIFSKLVKHDVNQVWGMEHHDSPIFIKVKLKSSWHADIYM